MCQLIIFTVNIIFHNEKKKFAKIILVHSGKQNRNKKKNSFVIFLFLACGILVPWPGIKPRSPAVEVQSCKLWTARELPHAPPQSLHQKKKFGKLTVLIERSEIY